MNGLADDHPKLRVDTELLYGLSEGGNWKLASCWDPVSLKMIIQTDRPLDAAP